MPEEVKDWDVIVIGGGLAGSAAAIWLSRAGKKVLLIEKTVSAHHKVCGEFISIEAQHYLKDLDIDLAAEGAETIKHLRLVAGKGMAEAALPFNALSLSRYRLDELLLEAATSSGVEVMRGIAVNDIAHIQNGREILLANGQKLFATTIFIATGKHELRGHHRTGKIIDMIGLKMHHKLSQEQTESLRGSTEVYLFDGGYAGLELVENDMANLCLVIKKGAFANMGKSWETVLMHLSNDIPLLAERLKNAEPLWNKPLAIYGIPYGYVSERADNGVHYLGDQQAVIPSIFGDGMAIALHTAYLVTQNYLNPDTKSLCSARIHLRNQVRLATIASWLLGLKWLQPVTVKMLRSFPHLLRPIIIMTRCRMPPP